MLRTLDHMLYLIKYSNIIISLTLQAVPRERVSTVTVFNVMD